MSWISILHFDQTKFSLILKYEWYNIELMHKLLHIYNGN